MHNHRVMSLPYHLPLPALTFFSIGSIGIWDLGFPPKVAPSILQSISSLKASQSLILAEGIRNLILAISKL
jgi:hypothetical protein